MKTGMWKGREDVVAHQDPHFWFPSQRLLPRTTPHAHLHKGLEGRQSQENQTVLILTYFQPSVVLQFSQ